MDQIAYFLTVFAASIGGLVWGILGGSMPGLSPSIAMALLLPFTYTLPPVAAIVMLATCYIGAEYGGSIPAILIRTPGTNAAAATVIDGYEMAVQGRASEALGISLWSGVVGSLLGLSVIVSLSGKSLLKGAAAAILGLMIATIGSDPISGVGRYTFGSPDLIEGVAPLLVMVGLFALTELMTRSGTPGAAMMPGASIRVRLPRLAIMKKIARSQ